MKRGLMNLWIDGISYLTFVLMLGTGMVLQFILPPGSGRVERLMHGGRRFEKTIDLYLGFSRHEWGEVHFYLSILFLVCLLVHLLLHSGWLKAVLWGLPGKPRPLPLRLTAALGVIILLLVLLFPLLGGKKTVNRTEFLQQRNLPTEP